MFLSLLFSFHGRLATEPPDLSGLSWPAIGRTACTYTHLCCLFACLLVSDPTPDPA